MLIRGSAVRISNSGAAKPSTRRSAFIMNSQGSSAGATVNSCCTGVPAATLARYCSGRFQRIWRNTRSCSVSLPWAPAPMPR